MIGQRRGQPPDLTVYTRRGCHLCEQAEVAATRASRRGRARLRIIDIDTDPTLERRYGIRVPVITIDGQEVAELEVDPAELREALRAAARTMPRAAARTMPRADDDAARGGDRV